MLLTVMSILVLAFWLSRFLHFRPSHLRHLPLSNPCDGQALVSMIVAARDEEDSIEANVRSLLAQSYPSLELIVVNDRSSDQTGPILMRLAAEFPRLKVIHQERLAEGWLGKCWALHTGSKIAQGEWLIFCDGDVILAPDALKNALATAQKEGLDHLTMAPRMLSGSWWEEAVITSLSFLFFIFQDPADVNRPERPKSYLGIGAFNMVRSSLYRSWGGHEPLRLEVVDDVFLGMLVKRNKGRSAFFLGFDQASLRWYPSLWAYIKGVEKNSFAGLQFSVPLLIVAILGQIIIFQAPLVLVLMGEGVARLCFALALLASHACYAIHCYKHHVSLDKALALTLVIGVQFFAFSRSAWITLRRGGIEWRGNFYPLQSLRQAQRRLRRTGS